MRNCATASRRAATAAELSTPWDVAWWDGRVVVAMAGSHQLWTWDPATGTTAAWAGTTNEGLRDGPPAEAFFAQPSGLAVGDGVLWVADAETSALREVRPTLVATAVGQGLFDFGHRDGAADAALLQHPLGVAVLPDGSVAIADTYNGAVRRYDPVTRTVSTLADGLAEPGDVLVDDNGGGDTLVVVESAAHRLTRLPIPASVRAAARVAGHAQRVRRTSTDVAPGRLALRVAFVPPTGQHLDTRFGEPTQLTVTASPPELLTAGAGTAPGLSRELRPRRRTRGGAVGQRRGRRVRRGRRGLRGVPPLPAGLGHPGAPRRRRTRRTGAGSARRLSRLDKARDHVRCGRRPDGSTGAVVGMTYKETEVVPDAHEASPEEGSRTAGVDRSTTSPTPSKGGDLPCPVVASTIHPSTSCGWN